MLSMVLEDLNAKPLSLKQLLFTQAFGQ